MVEGNTDEESYASEFANSILNNDGADVDDTRSKIEPGSQKENLKRVSDNDGTEKEKETEEVRTEQNIFENEVENEPNVEAEKTDEIVKKKEVVSVSGSQEIRNEQKQTPILSPIRSLRNVSFLDKTVLKDLIDNISPTTATTSQTSFITKHKKRSFTLKPRNLPGKFFAEKIQEVLKYCGTIVPELTVAKTNEMLKKEMPYLVKLAVDKDQEVSPVDISGMVSKEFAAHRPKLIKELFRKHMQNITLNLYPKTSPSTATTSSVDLQQQLYLNMKAKPHDQAADPEI
ncbi:hypothetical protein Tco_0978680 [Tanacetum coccineum]|uniref:Uncharacterized protein n=1 Tax=Tanacetum coccineum TaxID=301880 RepID=A0ABQ5EP33_9ASTR